MKILLILLLSLSPAIAGSFERAIDFVLAHEDSTFHPDRYGMCKFGICKNANPDVDVKHLTRAKAIKLYHDRYWERCNCDLLDSNMALVVFDGAVISGQTTIQRLSHNVYDASALLEIRRNAMWSEMNKLIKKKDCEQLIDYVKYIPGWERRFDDLQKVIYNH
jgi:lysozyme family protein